MFFTRMKAKTKNTNESILSNFNFFAFIISSFDNYFTKIDCSSNVVKNQLKAIWVSLMKSESMS